MEIDGQWQPFTVESGELAMCRFVVQTGQTDLLEIVFTLRLPRSLASGLYCRKQQCDQHGNDRDHYQQLYQRKTTTTVNHFESPIV